MLPTATGRSQSPRRKAARMKVNRHPSDADLPPLPHSYSPPYEYGSNNAHASHIRRVYNLKRHRRYQSITLSTVAWPVTILSCRIAACIGMSYFGGLSNRIAYAPSQWSLLRDLCGSVLENNLILIALEGAVVGRSSPRASARDSYRQRRFATRLKRIIQRSFAAFIAATWVVASWGDYVFESETRGLIPTMWVIAPGLKDPTVHAGVQLRTHKSIFVGGLALSVLGLCIGVVYALVMRKICIRDSSRSIRSTSYTKSRHKSSIHSGCGAFGLSDTLKQPKLICWNIVLLITLFCFGAWAPLTNLTYCIVGIMVLTPPGGGMKEGSVVVATGRGVSKKAKEKKGTMLPNVVVVVHESLSGAAMQSARGIDAAPFFHSMRPNPDFYDFKYARTTAGTTPIATPGLLTGLMPFTDEGVRLVKKASLAQDFKRLGYDTGCFASYGADWTGNAWDILSYMLMPGFDAIFDPKATGDPLVNEYGSDDRTMINHVRDWLKTRRGPGNSTAPRKGISSGRNATARIGSRRHEKPFFALIVQNNNHFPHLKHETYSGDPECDKKEKEKESSAGKKYGMYKDEWGEEEFGGPSCGYSEVSRYFSSIRTIDEALQGLFQTLEDSRQLNNTILVGAGDHGEVPGILERMEDVNAPILDIPLWMYIPKHLLPREKTYLRDNVNRGVSILDAVATLRDLVGFNTLYTPEEEEKCVVGQSLLSQPVPNDRVMLSWQGLPLQGQQIGIFSTASEALIYYKKDPSKTKHIDYSFDEADLFFRRTEKILNEEPEKRRHWKDLLQRKGLFGHGAVKKWMPDLEKLLD